ncbi:helix-hairpin-helix domain-containing protein, partial [Candidatus Woesearchaeota archaeon]|nr:helix-hairpin-helix domain-containing protein [Candidatus Woesearchaeota archaeon]
ICHTFTQDGRCVSLFKTLLTNECKFDCKYCQNPCAKRKAMFEPDELARTFMSLYVRNYVEGLFLSSGIAKDPDFTTEQMIETVNLIRTKYKFHGYIHFKILPGTSYELIKQASEFADRMSINIEAPNKSRMSEISNVKDFKIDILRRQSWIKHIIKKSKVAAGQTTQLVIGGSDETDFEILKMIDWEYEHMELKRGYYSAFTPIKGTEFEKKPKQPLLREHRLFNIDFMLRNYKMKLNDFKPIMQDGMLPLNEDPKLALAKLSFDTPVDVNQASFEELMKVPGIGPVTARRIRAMQKRKQAINSYLQLHNMGVVLKRAKPFIGIQGRTQTRLKRWLN